MFQHLVNDAVFLGLRCGQEGVDLDVFANLLHIATGMLGQRVLQPFTHTQHLLGLDFNLRGLAEALVDGRLVDEHAGVRQHQPFAFGAGGQQDGRGRGIRSARPA